MQHTFTLPKYLSQHKADIQKGLTGEKGTPWNVETWKKFFTGNPTISNDLDAIWKQSAKTITRDDVTTWASSTRHANTKQVRRLFLVSMIWGWGNRGIGIKSIRSSLSSPNYEKVLTDSLNMIKAGKIKQAYENFSLPGCGPAFFTKFFYFVGLAHNLQPLPVILDANVAQCLELICKQAGWDLKDFVIVDRNRKGKISNVKPCAEGYLNFVYSMDSWAKQLGCRADFIEYFMYQQRDKNSVGKGGKMARSCPTQKLEVDLPPEKMRQVEAVARDFNVDESTLCRIWILERLQQCRIWSNFAEKSLEGENSEQVAAIVISGKVVAPDGENKPRREIGRISKEDCERVTCKGGPLDISIVEHEFGASWNEKGTVLLIPIKLLIGSDKYDATLHYSKASHGLWIGSPLNGGKVKLAQPLAREGFGKGDLVKLKVRGNTIQVTK